VQVYAPELDPINVQKQPRLRLPQAAAADLESGTDLNPSNAAPSTLQVPYLTETKFFVFASRQKIRVRETPPFASTVLLAEMENFLIFAEVEKGVFVHFHTAEEKEGG
jgi:hypothetical protein